MEPNYLQELADPVNYSLLWPLLVFLAAAAVGLWFYILLRGRNKKAAEKDSPPRPRKNIKQSYLQRLGQIEASYAHQNLSKRDVYIELSYLLRSFVDESMSAHLFKYMTLKELENHASPAISSRIALWYNHEFAPGEPTEDPMGAIADTRELIKSWS